MRWWSILIEPKISRNTNEQQKWMTSRVYNSHIRIILLFVIVCFCVLFIFINIKWRCCCCCLLIFRTAIIYWVSNLLCNRFHVYRLHIGYMIFMCAFVWDYMFTHQFCVCGHWLIWFWLIASLCCFSCNNSIKCLH